MAEVQVAKALCLNLRVHNLGCSRKLSPDQYQVDGDKAYHRASKNILNCAERDAIATLDGETWRWINDRALPSPLRAGIYLLPVPLLEEVESFLSRQMDLRQLLVEQFILKYEENVEVDRLRFTGTFRSSDYPTVAEVRARFTMSWNYMEFGVPTSIESISAELFAEEKAKSARMWDEAMDECKTILRGFMRDLVDHLVERLTPGEDGKPKVFRDSLVRNMTDFLSRFDVRNLASDAELAAVVREAKNILTGVAPKDLRGNTLTRDYVRDQFAKVKTSVDGLVASAPARKFLGDEE